MVTLGIGGLIAAYVLIALLLLSLLLYSTWSWKMKAGTIVATSLFYIITYLSFPPLLGWPTAAELPKRFQLISAYVEQPSKVTGAPGKIFLWLTDMENLVNPMPPRAYRLQYSLELHEKIISAQTKISKGMPQLGEVENPGDGPLVTPLDAQRAGQKSINVQFYDLPDPLFPEK